MQASDAKTLIEAFDALDTGVAVLAGDGTILGWNAWLASASGRLAAEVRGAPLADVFREALPSRLEAAVGDALQSGTSSLLTYTLHRKLLPLKTRAGQEMVHNISVRPLGPRSAPSCLVQVFDVTAVAEREHLLRERQNARYDAVVQSAPDAILTLDSRGIIQLANPAAAAQFGYDAGELLGQPVAKLMVNAAPWSSTWSSLMKGNRQQRPVALVARRHDGSTTHLEVSASLWRSDQREFVTAIFRDVNERHAAEETLRRLNETLEDRVATTLAERKLLADIVEHNDAYIQVFGPDHRLRAVNRSSADEFERIFGVRPRIGDALVDLIVDPEQRARMEALWSRALAGEEFITVEPFGLADRDQRQYEFKFSSLTDGEGRRVAGFQFVYDVTDRLAQEAKLANTEEALRQSQKMEAIGQLTGGIAHDFNNLLTGIIGSMDVLKRRISSGRYDDTQRFMDAAVTSANRAAALTHRLLAFARRQPLDPKGVDANQLIRSIEDDLIRRTIGEQVRLETSLAPDLWPTMADANQLENAILNLAINARDAMPEGGRLTIKTQNVQHRPSVGDRAAEIEPGDYTVISVADTGVGMTPEVISKVFDPFFTTKPLGEGTGLGLSMIYGFAKQSRGHVRIESEVGKGSEVSLYLPRFTGELKADLVSTTAELAPGAGETVLLVEDDSSVRLLIGEVLRDLGYACIEAVDAQAALPVLNSNARVDLMITDVGLPGMNGRQLATIARERRPALKILFVTGYAEHATGAERFIEPGMALVTKPFALDALALKIRDMLVPRPQ